MRPQSLHRAPVLAALATIFLASYILAASPALGETFHIDLPGLQGPFPYGQPSAVVPVNLGTPLASLTSIQLEISGVHTAGWWVGDGVENFYVGPKGGYLYGYMDSASGYSWRWVCSYEGQADGPFSTTVALRRAGGGADWSFLQDGRTDFCIDHESLIGWGAFTALPSFNLTRVALVIDAAPLLPGDTTLDGRVDAADLNRVLTNFNRSGMTWGQGDVTGDGQIDASDLTKILTNYNKTLSSSSPGSAVPEPSSLLLLLAGVLFVVGKRRAPPLASAPKGPGGS